MALHSNVEQITLPELQELEDIYAIIHQYGTDISTISAVITAKDPYHLSPSGKRLQAILGWFRLIGIEDDPTHADGGTCTSACTQFRANLDRDILITLSEFFGDKTLLPNNDNTQSETNVSSIPLQSSRDNEVPFRKFGAHSFCASNTLTPEDFSRLEKLAIDGASMRDIMIQMGGRVSVQGAQHYLENIHAPCPPMTDDIGAEFHQEGVMILSTRAMENMLKMEEMRMSLELIGSLMGLDDVLLVVTQLKQAREEAARRVHWEEHLSIRTDNSPNTEKIEIQIQE